MTISLHRNWIVQTLFMRCLCIEFKPNLCFISKHGYFLGHCDLIMGTISQAIGHTVKILISNKIVNFWHKIYKIIIYTNYSGAYDIPELIFKIEWSSLWLWGSTYIYIVHVLVCHSSVTSICISTLFYFLLFSFYIQEAKVICMTIYRTSYLIIYMPDYILIFLVSASKYIQMYMYN